MKKIVAIGIAVFLTCIFLVSSVSAAYAPPNPDNLQNATGNFWVNYTWDAGSGNVTNSYNVSWNSTWYNDTTNTYMNKSVGASGWANITVYAWNSSGTLSAGSVSDEVQASFGPPVVTLLSQTPSIIYQNTTGYLNISYGITHNSSGLNNTSVSFIYRNYDHTLNDGNHSIRPPENNLSAVWDYNGRILRAANRNETLNFENNDTITGGDIYTWSGLDENNTRLTIVPVNSTYTIVHINGSLHKFMPQMWYLDRTDLQEAPKTQLGIYKTQKVLIKFWNFEIFKGNYDYLGVGYTDTSLDTNPVHQPTDANPINYYYVNSSYDPVTGGDPLASGYAVYMGSLNASGWTDHVYKPHANSSYVRGFINGSLLHSYINTTKISYLYFTSNTPAGKPYYINVTNAPTNTNVSFADTNVLWAGNNPPYTPQSYTPNNWFAFMKDNISFDHKIYAADNNGQWTNSTLDSTLIGKAFFPPTKPTFYSFHDGFIDRDMNGTYDSVFDIQIGPSSDPDGGIVTHNLTLHYGSNHTYVATINNTFTTGDGVFVNITFDSTPYYSSDNYTLRVIAIDDESESITVWLGVNFSISAFAYVPPDPINLANTTGNFWVNYTWNHGSGNVTDSYNVSWNSTWYNTTTNTYMNKSVGAHGWANITVWGYNSTDGVLSESFVDGKQQIPNNPVTITNCNDWSGTAGDVVGELVELDFGCVDLDGDVCVFSTNAIYGDLNTSTGIFKWQTEVDDDGAYLWQFNVSDDYGSSDNCIVAILLDRCTLKKFIDITETSYALLGILAIVSLVSFILFVLFALRFGTEINFTTILIGFVILLGFFILLYIMLPLFDAIIDVMG